MWELLCVIWHYSPFQLAVDLQRLEGRQIMPSLKNLFKLKKSLFCVISLKSQNDIPTTHVSCPNSLSSEISSLHYGTPLLVKQQQQDFEILTQRYNYNRCKSQVHDELQFRATINLSIWGLLVCKSGLGFSFWALVSAILGKHNQWLFQWWFSFTEAQATNTKSFCLVT